MGRPNTAASLYRHIELESWTLPRGGIAPHRGLPRLQKQGWPATGSLHCLFYDLNLARIRHEVLMKLVVRTERNFVAHLLSTPTEFVPFSAD